MVLIDFGQAVHDIHRTMGQTMVTGTLGYQSLEQIIGNASTKSDVYSVGVVAVELLTGLKAHTMLEGQVLRWERKCRELPLPIQEWLDKLLHQDPNQRFSAAEALSALEGMADVFVEVEESEPVAVELVPVSATVSEDFLGFLEDAIEDENEEKRAEIEEARQERERAHQAKIEQERKQREEEEAAYRQQVEAERQAELQRREEERQAEIKRQQEAEWSQQEEALWAEMLGSWEQLLNTVASKRVSADKAFVAYRRAFEDRVSAAMERRTSGALDERVLMLLGIVQPTMDPTAVQTYLDWVLKIRLREEVEQRDEVAKRLKNAKQALRDLKSELEALSWWGSLWKKSDLEKQIEEQSRQVAALKELYQERETLVKVNRLLWLFDFNLPYPPDCVDEVMLIPKSDFMMGDLRKVKTFKREESNMRRLYTDFYAASNVGGRDNNEDFGKAFKLQNFDVLIICDGLGGHDDGAQASKMTVNIIEKQLELLDAQRNLQFDEDFLEGLENAVQLANSSIYGKSQRDGWMIGTTMTMVLVWKGDGPKYVWIGWCGDSKVYMMDNSTMETIYISKDHNTQRAVSETDPLTPLERPDALKQAIGVQPEVDHDYLIFELDEDGLYYVAGEGTREPIAEITSLLLLLCSDGLTSVFERAVFPYTPENLDAEDERILSSIRGFIKPNSSPEETVHTLIDRALQRRTDDNVTVGAFTLSFLERVPVYYG